MTTVNKCPECNAIMLRSTSCESCGWPRVRPKHAEAPKFQSRPNVTLMRLMAEKEHVVNNYVRKFQAENPKATKREACLAFLAERKLTHMLPKALITKKSFDDAMDEYRFEQESV